MNCKNCDDYLQHEYRFCPNCGAKTEVRRITFGILIKDVLDRVFDLDNSLFRTLRDMILKPEAVIHGYVTGLRKRYLNPVSLLGIALTLAGLLIFIMQKMYGGEIDFTGGAQAVNPEFSRKWGDLVFDFNAVFFFIYIPVLAIPAYLLLNSRKYNLAEICVAFIYGMSTYSILSFPISMVALLIGPENYLATSQPMLAVTLGYMVYLLWRLTEFKIFAFIGRSILYLILVIILFFLLVIGIMILLLLTGYFSLEDFKPMEKEATTTFMWIAETCRSLT